MIVPDAFGGATLRRIEWLTLVVGAVAAVVCAWVWGWQDGAGLALGAALSWINFRWLKGSVRSFAAVTVPPVESPDSPAGSPSGQPVAPDAMIVTTRVPISGYVKFFGRFALLLVVVYVILTRSPLHIVPVVTGLFAAAAATVLGLLYELASGAVKRDSRVGRP
jgi:hypothetical protein